MSKQHFSPQKRHELLKAFAKSGLSVQKYANANGIGYSTMQRWLRDDKITTVQNDNSPSSRHRTNGQKRDFSPLCTKKTDSTVQFMDITEHAKHKILPQEAQEDAHFATTNEVVFPLLTSSRHCDAPLKTYTQAPSDISSQVPPKESCQPLDVLLPNGILLTLHQTSFDACIKLIKSLV